MTRMIARWNAGDKDALGELMASLYDELRRVARRHLKKERVGHSFQSCVLVHEMYLRLGVQAPFEAESGRHFVRTASRLMRQILVDHARGRNALKRGADKTVYFDTSLVLPQLAGIDVVRLDDALSALAKMDEQQERIVELRFFGGLMNEEVADVLGISVSTVKRDWAVARAWLARELRD